MKNINLLKTFMLAGVLMNSGVALSQYPYISTGNLIQVVKDLAPLIDDDSSLDSEIDSIENNNINCPNKFGATDSYGPEDLSQSPLEKNENSINKNGLFFDFQFLPGGNNGTLDLNSSRIPAANVQSSISQYSQDSGLTREQVLALADDDLKDVFTAYSGNSDLSSHALNDLAEAALVIARMSDYSTASEAINFAGEQLKDAPFSRKIAFLSSYLNHLSNNYEYDMIDGGPTVGEDRWDDDLHSAMSTSIKTGAETPSGVCRHMHQMAIRLARSIGIDEAFGVGFRTARGGHRTMVLTHPDNPGEVVQLNYGRVATNNGVTGASALGQNGSIPDAGIRFRIYDGNDSKVLVLPSELGGVLNRVTGGSDSDLGPRYEDQSQIKQVGVNTPYGTIRIFKADSSLGNNAETIGMAYNKKVKFNDIFYGDYGFAGYHSQRDTQTGTQVNNGVYGRATHGANFNIYQSDNVALRAFSEVHLRGSSFKASYSDVTYTSENSPTFNSDVNLDSQFGISADYRIGDSWNRTSFITHGNVGNDAASNGVKPELGFSTFSIDHDSYLDVGNSTNLNLGAGLTIYNLGTGVYGTYNSNLGVMNRRTKSEVDVEFQGRLTNDTPIWLPEAEHTGSISLQQRFGNDRYYIGINGRQSFDMLDNYYVGLRIGGRIGGK